MLFNNSRYFGQNNRDSKISIILIRITDVRRRDCIAFIAWDFAIPSGGRELHFDGRRRNAVRRSMVRDFNRVGSRFARGNNHGHLCVRPVS